MSAHKINIELHADGGAAVREMGKVGKASTDLVVNVRKIGKAFGEFGGFLGDLVSNIFKGGVWGIMNAAIQGVISLFGKWRNSAKEAAEATAEAMKKSAEEMGKVLAAIETHTKKGLSGVDEMIKKRKAELESVYKLAMAEKELQKQRALAAGDKTGATRIESEQRDITKRHVKNNLELESESYEQRKAIAEKAARDAENAWKSLERDSSASRKRLRQMVEDVKRDVRGYNNLAFFKEGENPEGMPARARAARIPEAYRNQEEQVMRERILELRASAEYQAENTRHEELEKRRQDAKALAADMKKQLEDVESAERQRQRRIKAESAASAAKALDTAAKSEIDAAKAAAAERDRLDRELHQKRMDDLKAEMAAQKEAASPLRATVAAAQSEFERAFAMYRSPEQAASQIAEERDRASDLKQLHKDASRYGGKWRIDELAGLMAAGDSAGVQSRLEDWRKSKSFTPEVEAMVRASAAEQTKTTAEDELRKLNDKTGELAQKIETLAQSRDGKLDGIERNTNQLANKLDELLQVKG